MDLVKPRNVCQSPKYVCNSNMFTQVEQFMINIFIIFFFLSIVKQQFLNCFSFLLI